MKYYLLCYKEKTKYALIEVINKIAFILFGPKYLIEFCLENSFL